VFKRFNLSTSLVRLIQTMTTMMVGQYVTSNYTVFIILRLASMYSVYRMIDHEASCIENPSLYSLATINTIGCSTLCHPPQNRHLYPTVTWLQVVIEVSAHQKCPLTAQRNPLPALP
jgi:hypothetical protein